MHVQAEILPANVLDSTIRCMYVKVQVQDLPNADNLYKAYMHKIPRSTHSNVSRSYSGCTGHMHIRHLAFHRYNMPPLGDLYKATFHECGAPYFLGCSGTADKPDICSPLSNTRKYLCDSNAAHSRHILVRGPRDGHRIRTQGIFFWTPCVGKTGTCSCKHSGWLRMLVAAVADAPSQKG